MNEIVRRYGQLPSYAQQLMDDLMYAAKMRREALHKDYLGDMEKNWLERNGFKIKYDKRIDEWRISWNK